MIANTVEVEGTLQADGKLILDEKPAMPPGRVRVALQPLAERLPDGPLADDCISAPFDLPHEGTAVRVHPRVLTERLPDMPTGIGENAE